MIETILQWDQDLFFMINGTWTTDTMEQVLPVLRDKLVWLPLYVLVLAVILFNNRGWKALAYILVIAATVTITDTVSSKLIKPSVERVRPCNDESIKQEVILRARCGGGYSFTSSHATNHFGLSMALFLLLGNRIAWRWLIFLWAALVSYAQIYVGVHYPLDILGGAVLGVMLGYLVYATVNWFIFSYDI
ncbi:MAG: phosphatase PAP2 family protein [Saprospiraceae bacterium]|nr:phosphatase PAP2 family protein [Saprospiraceae bacterium]